MRHSRLTPVPLVAVAHGSRDPQAAATIGELLAVVRERARGQALAGLDVRAAFLDHCAPSLPQALSALASSRERVPDGGPPRAATCVVLPLLLTAAYHSKNDIPAQIAAAGCSASLDIRRADPLGPHPLLIAALERRLASAGVDLSPSARAATGVVLAVAGSSEAAANAANAALAASWQRDGGWRRVVPAYASAAAPSPAEVVAALRPGPVVVATYLLSPGYFADKVLATALVAGADAVSGVLGAAPEVADVILARYAAAIRGTANDGRQPLTQIRTTGFPSIVAMAQLCQQDRGNPPVNFPPVPGKPTWNGCTARAPRRE